MKKKLHNRIIILLFCLAISAVPVLFLLMPKKDFSELEKRYLEPAPELTRESLLSGTFTGQLGRFVADHFPGRELFVGINAYFDLLAGREAAMDYFPGPGGRLYSQPVEVDEKILNANLDSINAFARDLASTEADIPLTLMLVPSAGSVLMKDGDYPDRSVISYAYEHVEAGHVDLMSNFRHTENPELLYYRTDHHWTSEGAFLAACAYRRVLGLPVPSREDYTLQR